MADVGPRGDDNERRLEPTDPNLASAAEVEPFPRPPVLVGDDTAEGEVAGFRIGGADPVVVTVADSVAVVPTTTTLGGASMVTPVTARFDSGPRTMSASTPVIRSPAVRLTGSVRPLN